VASAGDVNNDGYSDVVVGAPFWDEGGSFEVGKAWLFLGSPGGLSGTPAWSVTGSVSDGGGMGSALAPAGDVNGDGFADFLVGEPRNSAGGIHYQGKAYLFLGNALGGRARLRRQWNGQFSRRIGPQGIVDSDLALGLEHALLAPAGYQDLSFQLEAKPLSAPLDGTGLTAPPFSFGRWRREVIFTANIPLLPLSPYRWRVRAISSHPFF